MSVKNLWGPLPESAGGETPLTILREQAELLQSLTGRALYADVHLAGEAEDFEYSLRIVAPSLNNYAYYVVTVTHGVDRFYPLKVTNLANGKVYECTAEPQYKKALAEILSSPTIHNVLARMLALSNSLAA